MTMDHAMEPRITIITATMNAAADLPKLIESLQRQTCRNFLWVVADGGSTDGTIGLLDASHGIALRYVSEPDFGIYDAFNKALRMVRTEYYLVMGADDLLYPEAIARYHAAACEQPADLITAPIHSPHFDRVPVGHYVWSKGIWSVISNHSVGVLIRTSLHARHGFYSHRFPIAADMDFLTRAYFAGATVTTLNEMAGLWGGDGVSNRYRLNAIMESALVNVENGAPMVRELLFMGVRILRHYAFIRRQPQYSRGRER